MTDPGLGELLRSAVELLGGLDPDPSAARESARKAKAWSMAFPGVSANLLVSRAPAAGTVEYDLLMTLEGGATIALNLCTDGQLPWAVSFADHWAANFVVTINKEHVTIQQVLREIAVTQTEFPNMMTQIVDHVLEAQAVLSTEGEISPGDLQREVDDFRRSRGLLTEADTLSWLHAHAMTKSELGQLVASAAAARRLRARISDPGVESEFAAHPDRYQRITASVARVDSEEVAKDLARAAREVGVLAATERVLATGETALVQATVTTSFASQLHSSIRAADVDEVVGPFADSGEWVVGQVLRRTLAVLDGETAELIRGIVFESWLAARREESDITWHWV